MTNQPDPVFSGLAIGLKPADIDMPAGTIRVTDEQLEILRASERIRTVRATERLAELAEDTLAAQLRTAKAAERQAEAVEVIAALFMSVIGAANSKCGYGDDERADVVNFIRSGRGIKDFQCDEDIRAYAAEENQSD